MCHFSFHLRYTSLRQPVLSLSGLLSVLLLPCAAQAVPWADMAGDAEPAVRMEDLSKPGNPGKTFLANTVINVPMARLCDVIQDYAQYPAFMPNTHKTSVSPGENKTSLVEITLHLPLGKVKRYRLRMTPNVTPQQCRLDWKQVPWEGLAPDETIRDTSGYWLLTPQASNPNATQVSYRVATDPGPVPLGLGWIVDSMSRDSIPKMLESLRGRVR